ncbi:MAG: hypothetical protein RR893_12030 [Clostridia bacterium]
MLRLELVGGGGMHGSSCDNSKDFQRWFECLPFSAASICVDRATLLAGHGRLKVNLGFIIEASEAEKNGLYAGRYAQWLSARRCLHGIVRGSDDEPADPARFFPALDKLNALGLSLSGDPFTRMIGSYDVGDGLLRYDEAWFPIDEMMSR